MCFNIGKYSLVFGYRRYIKWLGQEFSCDNLFTIIREYFDEDGNVEFAEVIYSI